MSINFGTPVSFSEEFFARRTGEGKSTSLERIVQLVESCCTILQKTQARVKSVSASGALVYDKVSIETSCLEKSLKFLLCLLIIPMIMILALKLILRLALSVKYTGFIEDRAPDITPPPVVPVKKIVETPPLVRKPLTDSQIEEKYLTLPFSQEQQKRLREIGDIIFTSEATKASLETQGILISRDPSVGQDFVFSCQEFPGITFKYFCGRLVTRRGVTIERSSSALAYEILAKSWEEGVKILRPVLDKEGKITTKEKERLFKEHSTATTFLGEACVVQVPLTEEVVAFLATKNLSYE